MDEFSGAALGDLRLTKRLIRLVDDLSAEPTKRIPLACGGLAETKAAYRLLDNEAGVALGVLDAWMWARQPKGAADIKESRRWTEGYERIAELAERLPDTRLVYVADRESDLRELIDRAAELDHPADYLLRAKHDRVLAEGGKLRAAVARQTVLGEVEFALPAGPKRAARTVVQTVRAARVTLVRRAPGRPAKSP